MTYFARKLAEAGVLFVLVTAITFALRSAVSSEACPLD